MTHRRRIAARAAADAGDAAAEARVTSKTEANSLDNHDVGFFAALRMTITDILHDACLVFAA